MIDPNNGSDPNVLYNILYNICYTRLDFFYITCHVTLKWLHSLVCNTYYQGQDYVIYVLCNISYRCKLNVHPRGYDPSEAHRLPAARGPVLGRALLTSSGAGTP